MMRHLKSSHFRVVFNFITLQLVPLLAYLLRQVSGAELLVTRWQVAAHRARCLGGTLLLCHCGSDGPRDLLR